MGGYLTSEQPPQEEEKKEEKEAKGEEGVEIKWALPEAIPVDKVVNCDKESQERLCYYLFHHGYAIISISSTEDKESSQIRTSIKNLFEDRKAYFAQPQHIKDQNADKDNLNIGYVKVGDVREYIKLRKCDPEYMWPTTPSTMKANWTLVLNQLKDIAWKSFLAVSKYKDTKLSDPKMLSAIEEFVDTKSSISLIHYFPVTQEDKQCVCSSHEDTGLLTIGVCSDIPGLIMWDRVKKGWVEVEKHMNPGDIILFVGQKVPLFSGSSDWKATTHKVEIPTGTERYSFVFLLDVAK